jgi:hypothetical protein
VNDESSHKSDYSCDNLIHTHSTPDLTCTENIEKEELEKYHACRFMVRTA